MITQSSFRKVFEGVATRQQMFQMFDRHGQAPMSKARLTGRLYDGEWFEIGRAEHDYMFEILSPSMRTAGSPIHATSRGRRSWSRNGAQRWRSCRQVCSSPSCSRSMSIWPTNRPSHLGQFISGSEPAATSCSTF